eukprot:TRINITY_DN24545_c0_g1_i1.p1 TRINITY_DN24545_c0_g1~~TRINITY_DN24545_c0_g1_i1.p1  ORF type:complete len:209 (-),score=53.37 TRINITY_DN24545_c0_g1_i1:103-729(-)
MGGSQGSNELAMPGQAFYNAMQNISALTMPFKNMLGFDFNLTMDNLNNMMNQIMNNQIPIGQMGNFGQAAMHIQSFSSYTGPNGEPINENYMNQAQLQKVPGAPYMGEMRQAYANSLIGQRLAHERVLNDQGIKAFWDRPMGSPNFNNYALFRGVNEFGVPVFNQQWNNWANQTGFYKNFPQQMISQGLPVPQASIPLIPIQQQITLL